VLSKKIGIDLGTSTVLIYVKGEGIVINEPSLVAVNRDGTRILAVGKEAFEMVGRAPDTIQLVRPMREGVIADFVVTEGMLHHFIGKVQGRQRIFKPEIMICVPSGVTSVERRAVTEAAISAGARQAWLIDEPLAAAIGAYIISPFVGRVDDINEDGMQVVRDIVSAYRQQDIKTKVLAASLRGPLHVSQAALAGADIGTMPFSVLQSMFKHPLTDAGLKRFKEDYLRSQEAKPAPAAEAIAKR